MTNGALRSIALFGGSAPITRDQFFQFKWERSYAADSEIMRQVVLRCRCARWRQRRRASASARRWAC